jgi:hypothetical protein
VEALNVTKQLNDYLESQIGVAEKTAEFWGSHGTLEELMVSRGEGRGREEGGRGRVGGGRRDKEETGTQEVREGERRDAQEDEGARGGRAKRRRARGRTSDPF